VLVDSKMDKILLIGSYAPRQCGIATHLIQFEKKLAEKAEVDILSFKKTSAKYKACFTNPISLLRNIYLIKRYSKVYIHYCHEHFFFSWRNITGMLNIVILPIHIYIYSRWNVTVVMHEPPPSRFFFQRWGNKILFASCACIEFFSEQEKKTFENVNKLILTRYRIQNLTTIFTKYIDHNPEECRRLLGLESSAKIVLVIGFIKENKGIDIICDALCNLAIPNLKLYIVGQVQSSIDMSYYQGLLSKYSAFNNIHFLREHLSDTLFDTWIVASDYVALPYRRISNSGILARAILYRKEIIISDLPELVSVSPPDHTKVFSNPDDLKKILIDAAK